MAVTTPCPQPRSGRCHPTRKSTFPFAKRPSSDPDGVEVRVALEKTFQRRKNAVASQQLGEFTVHEVDNLLFVLKEAQEKTYQINRILGKTRSNQMSR